MTKDEALKLALEAMILNNAEWKRLADSGDGGYWSAEEQDHYKQTEQAITAIKEALAQPEQEPVACVEYIPCCTDQTCPKCKAAIKPELVCVCGAVWEGQELIYTLPQRTWVGVTDKEIGVLWFEANDQDNSMIKHFARAIEAKLKEKNT